MKNGSSGFPNHESIYSDCHRPSFAPSFRPSPTDRERGRVISPPSLSLPRLTPSARKLELSDLRIADQVQFFPAARSRERREVRKKEDKHPFIVEWVPRTTDAVLSVGRAGDLLLNDSCDGGSGRRSDRDWIGAILKASIHNGLGMIQNNGRWSDTERKRDERQR